MHTTSALSFCSSFIRAIDSFRCHWRTGLRVRSDERFALGVSSIWLFGYNTRFWFDAWQAMWHTGASLSFFASLVVLVLSLQALLLLLMPSRRAMLGAASALFLIAAVGSYFSSKFGAVMNKEMLRNVFETDAAEAWTLLTGELSWRVLLFGVLPAVTIWRVRLPARAARKRVRRRVLAIGGLLAACMLALSSNAASYAVFFREHKPIRFELMPSAPVTSAVGLIWDENRIQEIALINASGNAQRTTPPDPRPLLLVVVVGETARAANFQLGGYARATTPKLAATEGLVYFPNTTSCSTSTAISVPCMFSHLPRARFDVDEATHYENLLDALQAAHIYVEWRDNNSGCKGVCAHLESVDGGRAGAIRACSNAPCLDEVLIEDLPARLHRIQQDTVIVLHQAGSHGPAYHERYPAEFERFKPACRSNQLQRCSSEEVVNAYDNTILYTDDVLSRTIAMLKRAQDSVDTMLLYVSDHGESLGENGLYLHGLPYAFAPETQTHVPMLVWFSDSFVARQRIDMTCLGAHASSPSSHDNLYHTVLGASEVRNSSYDAALDLLAPCRVATLSRNHE